MDISAANGKTDAGKGHFFAELREDSDLPTDLDKSFSHWKVLVGHKDWGQYHLGLEGARRYRLHNLPSEDGFHAGVYELALYADESIHSVSTRRGLQKYALVPVYVGHAVNIRDRLQAYGRHGSHLEGPLQNGACQHCKLSFLTVVQAKLGSAKKIIAPSVQELCFSPHLFTRAFHLRYSIAYRWAATNNKGDAVDFEAYLLRRYDYAWNAGSNGKRRVEDAFRKLECICEVTRWYTLSKWIQKMGPSRVLCLRKDRIGEVSLIKCLPRLLVCNEVSKKEEVIEKNTTSFQLVSKNEHTDHQHKTSSSCELINGNSNLPICVQSAVRKQCELDEGMGQHMRSPALKTVLIGKQNGPSDTNEYQVIDGRGLQASTDGTANQLNQNGRQPIICGYILEDGSKCSALPRTGRKRCAAHKGRRIKVTAD